MSQADLFDSKRAEQLKQLGMDLGADNARTALHIARQVAEDICRRRGVVNADDVGRVLKHQYGIDTLGPAAGSIFKGKKWRFTGNWVKSKRTTNHSRMIREWGMF